ARECRRPAGTIELGKRERGRSPDLGAPEDVGAVVDGPVRAVLPPERLANGRKNSRDGLMQPCRGDKRASGGVLDGDVPAAGIAARASGVERHEGTASLTFITAGSRRS